LKAAGPRPICGECVNSEYGPEIARPLIQGLISWIIAGWEPQVFAFPY
jgi:hypothetical protein